MANHQSKLGRLKTRAEFLYVRNGKSAARHTVVIQSRAAKLRKSGINVGFTATKKIGNAVTRNRAKRRLRACAQEFLPKLGTDGFDYVLIARKDTASATWQQVCKDVEKALLRLA